MRRTVPAFLLLLCGCGESPSADEASSRSILPEAISWQEIKASRPSAAHCIYASGNSTAPVAIALKDRAILKWEGELREFQLDPLCEPLEAGTGSRYNRLGLALELSVEGEGVQEDDGTLTFQGSVRLTGENGLGL